MIKRRRLPKPPLNGYGERNERKRPSRRNRKSRSSTGSGDVSPGVGWRGRVAQWQEEYNCECRASGACPDPITNPLGWCQYEWSRKGMYGSPAWAGDFMECTVPMDHHQLAVRMVCLWGLVKAYQQTRQSTYVCPPAPHVIEAFNHKVNHDSHKELGTQELCGPTVHPHIAVCILLQ